MVLLVLYILFMFHIFKTSISINHPLEFYMLDNLDNYFNHPINTSKFESKICQFGKDIIWLLVIYLLYKSYYGVNKNINRIVIFITFILSLINFNAVLYLVPYFISELI